MNFLKRLFRNRRGAALVEYGLLVAGVALIAAAAVSIFGSKTNDLIGAAAAILPGASSDENAPIESGKLIETGKDGDNGGAIQLDVDEIILNNDTARLGNNIGVSDVGGTEDNFDSLILEARPDEVD